MTNDAPSKGPMPAADLDACEQEPLAFSGHIQNVGALMATRSGDPAVSHASDNLQRWFDLQEPDEPLLLNALFFDDVNYFNYRRRVLSENRHYVIANVITNRGVEGDLTYSRHGAHDIYEFEPKTIAANTETSTKASTDESQTDSVRVRIIDPEMEANLDIQQCMRQVHEITGYPKVMLYRFLPDGSGEVVAELSDGSLDDYQGLRFPASDIPKTARNLYSNNPYRLIFDTRVDISPVTAMTGDDALDLSTSTLRSVSPVHVEYLGNMGVRSSASFPIMVTGKLWGLMALHALESTAIPITQRLAVHQLLTHGLTRRVMDVRITAEHQRFNASVELIQQSASLLRGLMGGGELTASVDVLKKLVPCDGLILRRDGELIFSDADMSDSECAEIAELGRQQAMNNHFATDSVNRFITQTENYRRRVSGINYATTGVDLKRGRVEVIWVRTEQAVAVQWAGNPEKIRHSIDGEIRISPRKSFEAWSADTEGQSHPWASPDILMATKLMVRVLTGERRTRPSQNS